MKKEKSTKRLKLIDWQKNGRGIGKNEVDNKFGLKRFFVSYKDNFGKIVYCNIFMVLGNFPLIFLIATLSGATKAGAFVPMHDLFQNLASFFANEPPTPFSMTLYALEGIQNQVLVPTTTTYVFYGISALTLFSFGVVNVGTAYILRNIVKGEPVFVWADFFYAIKRNWKQALPFGIIDLAICGLIGANIYTMVVSSGNTFTSILFWANIVLAVVYFIMRYYIYVQMVTFKLTIFKILKNAMIFTLVGFKRNLLALLGIIFGLFLEFIFLFGAGGLLQPFAVAAPLAVLFSTFAYMKVYAAYYKIKEIMIDPYLAEHPEEDPDKQEHDEEVIMSDDVTYQQKLDEAKKKNGIQ